MPGNTITQIAMKVVVPLRDDPLGRQATANSALRQPLQGKQASGACSILPSQGLGLVSDSDCSAPPALACPILPYLPRGHSPPVAVPASLFVDSSPVPAGPRRWPPWQGDGRLRRSGR